MKRTVTKFFHLSAAMTLFLALMLAMTAQTAKAISGSGTKADPYLISSASDWNTFASNVTNGTELYNGKYLKLTANITVTTMAGKPVEGFNYDTNMFMGTFDGDGHTLTVHYGSSSSPLTEDVIAPFRTVYGATISFLHVDGYIYTSHQYAGGIIGRDYGQNNGYKWSKINNCQSSVKITTSYNGDARVGGVVAHVSKRGNMNISDCLFDGKILKSSSSITVTKCAGITTYASGSISNCLYDPAALSNGEYAPDDLTSIHYSGQGYTSTNNHSASEGTATQLKNLLGNAWEVKNNKAVPIITSKNITIGSLNDVVDSYAYTGSGISVSYKVKDAWGNELTKGTDYTESFSPSPVQAVGDYTLTVTGKGSYTGSLSTTIKVYKPLTGSGTNDNPYIISDADEWNTMALFVNKGDNDYKSAYYKLTANVSGVTTMAGTSSNKFCGTFDGDGHTLSISLGTSSNYLTEDCAAPFRYADGATFKFLHITGSIYTKNKFGAGLVGQSNGDCTITSCQSSVVINSNRTGNSDKDGTHGGFIGVARGSGQTVTITNSLFDGQLLGSNTNSCGGIAGWREGAMNIKNCLFAPSAAITIDAENSATLSRNGSSNCDFTDSYYKTAFGEVQGTDASGMTDNALKTALGSGWKVENNKVVPIMNGYNLASATITMDEYYKWNNDAAITINYTVKDAFDNDLTKGTHYTAVIKNSSNVTVNSVTAIDTYTLTITGKSPYSGSQSKTFEVSENLKENLSGFVFEKNDNGEYLIKTKADLNRLSAYTNAGNNGYGKTFVQTSNIDFEPNDAWNKADSEEQNFTPIGEFQGVYNGQGYTISGLRIHNNNDYQGLFTTIRGTVKNVKISNARIVGKEFVGGIGGYGYGTTTDCYVDNNVYVEGTGGDVGGIVGKLYYGTVSGCVSMANVYSGYEFCGGIVGIENGSQLVVRDNIAIGVIVNGQRHHQGKIVVGAIIGRSFNSFVNNYYSNSQATCSTTNEVKTSDIGIEFADADGAREGFTVTINSATVSFKGTESTYPTNNITTYSDNNVIKYGSTVFGAKGSIVKLAYSGDVPSGYHVAYTAVDDNNTPVVIGSNGEFTMPGSNVTVTGAAVVPDGKEAVVINGSITHGTIVSDKADGAINGETVTLTITPDAEYVMTSITVTNAEGNVSIAGPDAQFSTDLGGAHYYSVNQLTFTMGTSAATVDATFEKIEELNYVNIPKSESKSVTIPSGLKSFKVYDNSGKNGSYFTNDNGSLLLTAPEGYVMNVSGHVKLYHSSNDEDYLDIYDGNSTSATSLGRFKNTVRNEYYDDKMNWHDTPTTSVDATSSTNQMLLHFVTNGYGYVSQFGGVYLTVTMWPNVSLANAASNDATLDANHGKVCRVVLAGRTLTKNDKWNTLCLPFSLTASEIAASPLAGATIKEMATTSSLDNNGVLTLNFNTAEAITAGKPYIIKWASGSTISDPVFNGVTIDKTAPTEVSGTNVTFVGQYSPFTINNSNKNTIIFLSSNNQLGYSKNARELKTFRCHFVVPESVTASEFIFNDGEDMTTGIIEVEDTTGKTGDANAIFDLQGRKIANGQKPTAKGLYIVNGRKVVVK